MQYLGHAYTKQLFFVYLKFIFNWESCILSGDRNGGVKCYKEARQILWWVAE